MTCEQVRDQAWRMALEGAFQAAGTPSTKALSLPYSSHSNMKTLIFRVSGYEVKKLVLPYAADGMKIGFTILVSCQGPQKLKMLRGHNPGIPLPVNTCACPQGYVYFNVHCSTVCDSQKLEVTSYPQEEG